MKIRRSEGRIGARGTPGSQDFGAAPFLYAPVAQSQIAGSMRLAVLVGEDHRFFSHGGIDYQEMLHALGYDRNDFSWQNRRDRQGLWLALGKAWSRRDRLRGASTITQQLAKNLYLSSSRNPLRKVKEALTAFRLEATLGKDRILELYLNVVELGPGTWGVEAASRKYFGRSAAKLTEEQAAALAATLPFPLRSNPGYRPGRMRWRQNLIMRRMRGEGVELPEEPDETPGRPESSEEAPGSTPTTPSGAPALNSEFAAP